MHVNDESGVWPAPVGWRQCLPDELAFGGFGRLEWTSATATGWGWTRGSGTTGEV